MGTKENNILLAKFMGAKLSPYPGEREFEMYGIIECIEDGEDEQHFFTGADMEFHESWDWIMPVVEKIESMGYWIRMDYGDVMVVDDDSTIIIENPRQEGVYTKLSLVYQVVVSFIEWYEKQNSVSEVSTVHLVQLENGEGAIGLYQTTRVDSQNFQGEFDAIIEEAQMVEESQDNNWDIQTYIDEKMQTFKLYRVFAESIHTHAIF